MESQGADNATGWLGVIAVLFGLLLLASQGTELLKQAVIVPGSAAEQGIAAACRLMPTDCCSGIGIRAYPYRQHQ